MSENKKKRQVAKITVFITSIFVIFMSVTYAFITQTLTGTKEVVIDAGILDLVLEEENAITISDAFPMYDEVGMIQEEVFKFKLVNKTNNPTNYILKMTKIVSTNEIDPSDVKYYLTKEGVGEPKLLSSLPTDGTVDSGTIEGNDTIDYTLRLWIDSGVTDDNQISGKSLSYKMDVEVNQIIEELPDAVVVSEQLFEEKALGENCKTYNDGTDTYLVGQCSMNYIWYSGKLWRAVSKNNTTGAVKVVTQNSITNIILAGFEEVVEKFENSYTDQWLNQEFLPTLQNSNNYLIENSVWYETDGETSKTGTAITRTVGILNGYDLYTTYNNSNGLATSRNGYLNIGTRWWLMTTLDEYSYTVASPIGGAGSDELAVLNGVRPAVNMKSTVQIVGGTGIKSDPYILNGDVQRPVNGTTLLSTRYSGEYLTFNNELYRIVGSENGKTKITAVDKPTELEDVAFDDDGSETSFANATIKAKLETYYQDMKNTDISSYNMIEPNMTWYLGGKYKENYKLSICSDEDDERPTASCTRTTSTTTASIGLPRVGEMFTSQITRGTKSTFWTLTPSYSDVVHFVSADGADAYDIISVDEYLGARPSIYLKSNVVIASNNTGNGTYEKPYSIELGQ